MELNQKGLAVLELYEARQRHSTPNLVMEEQWQKLQPIVLLSRIEQHQVAGDIPKAFALLRQAMSQTPDDEDLWAKLEELMLIKHLPADESKHNKVLDINALQRELNHIEFILDQLEATSSDNIGESSRAM